MSKDTSLSQRIRLLLDASAESDPHVIATQMLASASVADRKAWVEATLPAYIATMMRTERNQALNQVAAPPSRRMPSASAKVAGVRDWWAQFLAARIVVDGTWKAVGDLDGGDLAAVVASRREQASKLHTQADRYEMLADLLVSHGVSTVRDLPSDVVLAAGLADAA